MPREFVNQREMKAGDWLMTDETGMGCFEPYTMHKIGGNKEKGFFLICPECNRRHMLSQATDARGRVTGFYRCNGLN